MPRDQLLDDPFTSDWPACPFDLLLDDDTPCMLTYMEPITCRGPLTYRDYAHPAGHFPPCGTDGARGGTHFPT